MKKVLYKLISKAVINDCIPFFERYAADMFVNGDDKPTTLVLMQDYEIYTGNGIYYTFKKGTVLIRSEFGNVLQYHIPESSWGYFAVNNYEDVKKISLSINL